MPVRIDELESRVEVEPGPAGSAAASPEALVKAVLEALQQQHAQALRRELERCERRLRARDFDD